MESNLYIVSEMLFVVYCNSCSENDVQTTPELDHPRVTYFRPSLMWVRSADAPKVIECTVRTACEDVEEVESIMQYF